MTKAKQVGAKRPKRAVEGLGPGLHLVHVDLGTRNATMVRTLDGRRLSAIVADEVHPLLVVECRRAGRMMIACDTQHGPTIVGALQTAPAVAHEPDGTLVLEGKRVRIVADDGVTLEAGTRSQMALLPNGKARLVGDRMVIDMSSNVRVLSALVELP